MPMEEGRENIHEALLLQMPSATKRAGRRCGIRNYRDESLYAIVQKVLPLSTDEWDNVADEYQSIQKDPSPHRGKNIKRHFFSKAETKKDPTASSLVTRIRDRMYNSQGMDNSHHLQQIKRQKTFSISNDEVDCALQQQGAISPLSEESYEKQGGILVVGGPDDAEIHPGILDRVQATTQPSTQQD